MFISSLDIKTAEQEYKYSTNVNDKGRFTNAKPSEKVSVTKFFTMLKRAVFEAKINTSPNFDLPLHMLTVSDILDLPDDETSIIRLGHSSILLKVAGQLWLIDPVFSKRASPFSFMGPKRFHQVPISLEGLPEIDGVIISHNHYDHMDKKTIQRLNQKVKQFVMPIGNAAQLQAWGLASEKLVELDWWQSFSVSGLELISTPAQHFSGRGLGDRDKALWSSWVIRSGETSVFFSGDSGYFEGFKEIGLRYGPFDLTMIENGAYDKDWADIHMTPKESARAHLDLRGRKMLPIHNGTFNLAFHEWTDPFEQLVAIADLEWIDLLTPTMGQVLTLGDEKSVDAARDNFWWK